MSIYRGAGGSGDATNDATVSQVQTYASQAATSATNAASSATAAAASASGASTSATLATAAKNDSVAISNTVAGYVASALASQTAASGSATSAATSATAAAISAGGASGSASDALDSANTATTQATAASTSATNSANSAASALAIYGNTTAMNTAVTNASNSAAAALASASDASDYNYYASVSATAAAASVSAASGSVTAAATSAGNAATSASNASSRASAASSSASSASTSASTATTQASNATTSATNASNSASTATTQAGIATTGGTTATTQAGIATTQAGIATTGATTATTQAGIATTQASNASTSATNAASSETNSLANRNAAATSATNASNSASAAATSATSSATSASAAATSAAAASAVALGNEPVRHSVRPSLLLDFANTKQLDPRITFTRASTATFYDGRTTAKAEENLLQRSQEFSNSFWIKDSVTVVQNNATAPDGTMTAATLTVTLGGGFLFNSIVGTFSGTYSIYIRRTVGTGNVTIRTAAGVDTPITVTSTWSRVAIASTNPNFVLGFATTGDAVEIWGVQAEARASVTAYTPTTTAAITNYIPALQTAASGVARFDHNPTTGESLGLLIEEQRVNLLTYSEDLTNAAWAKDATVVGNVAVAPDGTITADLVTPTANDQNVTQIASTGSPIGKTFTFSVYLKADTPHVASLRMFDTIAVEGAVVSVNVTTSWQRFTLTYTWVTGTGNIRTLIYPKLFGSGATNLSVQVWGAQLEAGAFATSYIPTVASQVTRSPDAASLTGTNFSSWYRQDEGTMYTEAAPQTLADKIMFSLSTASGYGNSLYMAAGGGDFINVNNGTATSLNAGSFTLNTNAKLAGVYKTNDFAASLNAATPVTSTTAVPVVFDRAVIGGLFGNTANAWNGTLRKIAYYPKRLTNQEIQSLTTV